MDSFLLTPALGRAARALLEWQQADLAKAAGLSLTAVNNFERKKGTTRTTTALALRNAFEAHGIEFLPNGGLRRMEDVLQTLRFSGKDFIARWNEDIYASVRRHGQEILLSSADEKLWFGPEVRRPNEEYNVWCRRMNVREKYLIAEGRHDILNAARSCYRALPQPLMGQITYCIYADRLAFVIWKKRQVVVLRNAAVIETFRHQFNYLWKIGRPV